MPALFVLDALRDVLLITLSRLLIFSIVSFILAIRETVPLLLTKLSRLLPALGTTSFKRIESNNDGLLSISRIIIHTIASRSSVKELALTTDLERMSRTLSIDRFLIDVDVTLFFGSRICFRAATRGSLSAAASPHNSAIVLVGILPGVLLLPPVKPTRSRNDWFLINLTTLSKPSPAPSSAFSIANCENLPLMKSPNTSWIASNSFSLV